MILAIDPGGCTGIAYLTRDGQFGTAQVEKGADGMWPYLQQTLLHQDGEWIDAIVCETFLPRPGAKSLQLDALHIIGALRYLCWHTKTPLIMQSPTQAKSFAGGQEKLRAAGWYTVGADHARDAARHMLVFLCSHKDLPAAYVPQRAQILAALVAS